MLRKLSLIALLILFSTGFIFGQAEKPKEADQILKTALNEAKVSHKNVFLIFHATWCPWCKRLDKVLETPEVKKIMDENYVITHLDVMERKEKVAEFENPGGKEIMKKLGGENAGLPFYAFLNSKGEKIADSNVMPDNSNLGFPGSNEELEAFKSILKKSAKNISDADYSVIVETIKKNLPPPKKS